MPNGPEGHKLLLALKAPVGLIDLWGIDLSIATFSNKSPHFTFTISLCDYATCHDGTAFLRAWHVLWRRGHI